MNHKQDSKNYNTIKSRLLLAMVLMTCCQQIMCLDLSYYAARLGITRTPTRKELLMLGGGVLFTAAAVYFLKQRWSAKKIGRGGGSSSVPVSPSENPQVAPFTSPTKGLQAQTVQPEASPGHQTSSTDKFSQEPQKPVTMSDKVYTWEELVAYMKKDKRNTFAIKLLKILGAPQKKRVEAIIQQLDNIYEQTEWPDLWPNRGVYTDTQKVEIAIILDELDQLYEEKKILNMPKFHEWFISLLIFDYSHQAPQAVKLEDFPEKLSFKYEDFIWCYIMVKEQITLTKWQEDNRFDFQGFYDERVEPVLSNLTGASCNPNFMPLIRVLREKVDYKLEIDEDNIALFVSILNVLYAVQRTPGIKDFYTTLFEKYGINRQNFLKLLASKNQEVHKALVAESTRINLQSNKDFFDWADRQRAISILERLIELTSPPAS